jgi:branched chain amino acid efflux pump
VSDWLTIAVAGAGTFAIRLSWLALARSGGMPAPVREALRFVTPAVLAAIIVPAVLYKGEDADFSVAGNERIIAALAAGAIAWATRNVWLTIGAGMAALWALKAIT